MCAAIEMQRCAILSQAEANFILLNAIASCSAKSQCGCNNRFQFISHSISPCVIDWLFDDSPINADKRTYRRPEVKRSLSAQPIFPLTKKVSEIIDQSEIFYLNSTVCRSQRLMQRGKKRFQF